MTEEVGPHMDVLYKDIFENNWPSVKEFIERHPRALHEERFASTGETPLHVAVKFGHVGMVKELVKLVPRKYLKKRDAHGYTPLGVAASHRGIVPIAKCLVDKNSSALALRNGNYKSIPVALAFRVGLSEMGRYLYSVTPLEVFKSENGQLGASFIRSCFIARELDIALDLLQRCEELLWAADYEFSTIEHIAFNLADSLNKNQLGFWKRWVCQYIKIPLTTATNHCCVDMQQEGEMSNRAKGLNLLQWLISIAYNLSGMKGIYNLKLQHTRATQILNLACKNLIFLSVDKKRIVAKALLTAAKVGNAEFFLKVSTENPELISMVTFPQRKEQTSMVTSPQPMEQTSNVTSPQRKEQTSMVTSPQLMEQTSMVTSPQPMEHAFFNAVENRQAKIFDLFFAFHFRNVVASMYIENNDNLLHTAAKLAPASRLNQISGAALQMQREWQWFKAVESAVNPGIDGRLNKDGLTPLDYFKKDHKELRNEGEKWMKDTASSCSVVGALIVTIMFAAAFTVPGGNDQNSGYPMFSKRKLFKVFLISDALSLFASTTSVLTFLGILTSRYAEEDFLYSLPKKLIIGLSSLFLSIATMLIAFSTTIIVMLEPNSSRSWVFPPIIMLASVPVTLFVLLQFPLLVEIIYSTYGPGIFNKKVKKYWPESHHVNT